MSLIKQKAFNDGLMANDDDDDEKFVILYQM